MKNSVAKSIIKRILFPITCIIHLLLNYKTVKFFTGLRNAIYTQWISYEIKKVGKNSYIYPKLIICGGKYIEIGNNTILGINGALTAWDSYENQKHSPSIKIGNNCSFGNYFHVSAINSIVIGNHVLTGKWVTIVDNSHGQTNFEIIEIPPSKRPLFSKGSVIIENNVWIGDKVTILANVKIGFGAIIGSNSVVTKDVPAFCVVGGNPVRIIKTLEKA